MEPDLLFRIANAFVLVGWAALVLAPGRSWAEVVSGWVVPVVISLAYVFLIATNIGRSDGGFSTLDGVARLFTVKEILLAGWLHYLAFDLLIGVHIVRESRALGVPHLAMVPILLLTFLFGPSGFLAFSGVRALVRARAGKAGGNS